MPTASVEEAPGQNGTSEVPKSALEDHSSRVLNGSKTDCGQLASHGAVQSTPTSASGGFGPRLENITALYSPLVEAKVWAVASKGLALSEPPVLFPEYTQFNGKSYVYRDREFWTSGFFPGTMYQLLYRSRRFPSPPGRRNAKRPHPTKLEVACKWWTEKLHENASMTSTHDLGFMITPWARPAWEMNNDTRALETLKVASRSLLSRFDSTVGLIRSWDTCVTRRYSFRDPGSEFLTVIDNMMNLDMLFYVASVTNDGAMWNAAVQHARTTQSTHIRDDYSTTHLVVFDPVTGHVRQRLTNQGYDDDSCWTRGQAWAIAGFAESYGWTRDLSFLETSRKCADYFLSRLPASSIPPWDFDAAQNSDEVQPTDTSAAMAAAYGMLLIYKFLNAIDDSDARKYLNGALDMISAICGSFIDLTAHISESPTTPMETVEEHVSNPTEDVVYNNGGDTILMGATINNYRFAPRRWANHGLVYADYYFVVVGNLLLEMGFGNIGQ